MSEQRQYSGVMSPGSHAVRELGELSIFKLSVGPMDNNAYLLTDRVSGSQVLIDAAAEPDRLLAHIGNLGIVVTTHSHADHWQGLGAVVAGTGAQTMAHGLDVGAIPVHTDTALQDGDMIRLGCSQLEVVHLGGHTPGSIALVYHDPRGSAHVFSGDGLFPGGVGKTASAQDFKALLGAVETKIFDRFDDCSWVYPGHGADTTLGRERGSLPIWRARGW